MPNLGIARGFIDISTKRLQQQRRIVARTSRQMGQDIQQGFRRSSSAVQSFERRIDSLNSRINAVRGELLALSVGGAALSGLGLRAADNLQVLQVRFREITGSQEEATALMAQLAQGAENAGLPVRELQNTFAGLVPILNELGEDTDEYIQLVARLTLLNPAEGTAGAVFAVREALASGGTDLVSLAERFNLPRQELRRLVEETGSFGEALDITLDKMGATTEAAEAQAQSLRGASARFRDAGQRALERAFTPALDEAAGALDTLTSLLDNTPDGILAMGGAATIAVTGLSAMTLALGQLFTTFLNLKRAGFFTAFAGTGRGIAGAGARVAPAAAAAGLGLAAGTAIGIGGVRIAGEVTGNERLKRFGLDDVIQGLRQSLALLVDLFLQVAQQIARAVGRVIAVFHNIPRTLQIIHGNLEKGFAGILLAIGGFIEQFSRFLPRGGNVGELLRQEGEALQATGQRRIDEAAEISEAWREAIDQGIVETAESLRLEFAETIGGVEQAAEEAGDVVEEETQSIADKFRAMFQKVEQARAEAFLKSFDSRVSAEREYLALLDQSPEQIASRIEALEQERQAIEAHLPALERLAQTNEDAAAKAGEYRQRLEEINTQVERFGPVLVNATRQAIRTLDTDFRQKVGRLEQERQAAINDAFDEMQTAIAELDADIAAQREDLSEERIEALQEFQAREQDIVSEHRERILQIERRGREDIIDAAARLDAAGVFAARQRREEALSEEQSRIDEEREKNRERLQDTRASLSEEAQEISEYYQRRHAELVQANQQDVAEIRQKFNQELNTARQAYNQERNQLQQHLNTQLQLQRSAQQQELALRQQGFNALLNRARNFTSGLLDQANRLASGRPSLQQQAANVGNAISNAFQSPMGGGATIGGSFTPAFQTGGVPMFAGGRGFVFAENKERVLSASQNAAFERLVNAISQPGQAAPPPDAISIDLTGVDSLEGAVSQIAKQVVAQVYRKQIGG